MGKKTVNLKVKTIQLGVNHSIFFSFVENHLLLCRIPRLMRLHVCSLAVRGHGNMAF